MTLGADQLTVCGQVSWSNARQQMAYQGNHIEVHQLPNRKIGVLYSLLSIALQQMWYQWIIIPLSQSSVILPSGTWSYGGTSTQPVGRPCRQSYCSSLPVATNQYYFTTGLPIDVMFGSRVGFLGPADPVVQLSMTSSVVTSNPSFKVTVYSLKANISQTMHPIHYIFGCRLVFTGSVERMALFSVR